MRSPLQLRRFLVAAVGLVSLLLAACAPAPPSATQPPGDAADDASTVEAGAVDADTVAVIHKSPTCECCGAHEDHLRAAGFATTEEIHEDLRAWKETAGIPGELGSCHTTEVGGYLVEGHVPAETIERLLAEQPDLDGIALPGMPAGSPGMTCVQEEPWQIVEFTDGAPTGIFEIR